MATKEAVKDQLDKIVTKLEEVGPYVAEDWGGSVQFIFPDLDAAWFLQMAMDGTVESLVEKIDEEAATGVVEMHSDAFIGVYAKTMSTDEARAKGQMRTRKSMEALIKVIAPTL
ncbi:MAG: hypothetical protein EHM35_14125 [Planctomycetaceae bacterium]|nr:MAG: hypothetical protein EHM35_14125 [Planctomycetaceae bacterium]